MFRKARKLLVGGSVVAVAAVGCLTMAPEFNLWASSENQSAAAEKWRIRLDALGGMVPARNKQRSALVGSTPSVPFDLLIIGGGATGCGIALDAATRGLKVGLVERDDFSSGTSSRSTKLVHGGVRYLEKAFLHLDLGQVKLVFDALDERYHMLRNAPHLCAPLAIMTPCYEFWEIPYYWAGLKLYDMVAGRQLLHLSRFYSSEQSKSLFPTLSHMDHGRSLKGTVVYYDGQFNDSRFNIALACTAALAGAAVLNHAEVVALLKEDATGKVKGAHILDHLTGESFDVHAKVIVNAAGPFCDEIRQMADENANPLISPSSGVHVILPDYYSPNGMGLIVPKTKDERVVFMLPWLGRTLAGTTDSRTSITMLPEPHEEEIQFILDAISDYLCVTVRRTDVHSAWSGIRPLASNPSLTNTANLSREHVVCKGSEGMVTIAGGKWTTYRSMAEDAVDSAIEVGDLAPTNGCITKDLFLMGGENWNPANFTLLAQQFVRMKKVKGGRIVPGVMDSSIAQHLSHSYGSSADRVATIAQEEGLGKRLAHGYPYLEAEVAYCARNEYCETAVDFIARRSRLAFLDAKAAAMAVPRVVEILASEHKWDRKRMKAELRESGVFLKTFKASEDAQ